MNDATLKKNLSSENEFLSDSFFFFFLSSYMSSENSLLTHSVPPKVIWNLVFNFLASWETSFAMEGGWGGGCD